MRSLNVAFASGGEGRPYRVSGLTLGGLARWFSERGTVFRAVALRGWFPGYEGCRRATRGVRTKQVGVNPFWRADVEAGVEGPSGAKTPGLWLSGWCRTRKGEALLAARWLAIAGAARSDGSVVVLVDHGNCRSRRTACGPRAPARAG